MLRCKSIQASGRKLPYPATFSKFLLQSPAMTILRLAHLDIEGLTLDSQVRALRDQVSHALYLVELSQ